MNLTCAYVSGSEDGSITVLALDRAAGRLQRLQTLDLGGTGLPMALDATRRRLFVSCRDEPPSVVTCTIDANGRLATDARNPLPASMAFLELDRSGRWLLGASYHQHRVAVASIDGEGGVQAADAVHDGGRHAHCIRLASSGQHAWSTSLGDDAVLQWRWDPDTGTLTPNDPRRLAMRSGSGPRHLALHPNGQVAWLLNELDATLEVLAIEAPGGTLRSIGHHPTLPPDRRDAQPWAADLHATPDARWLYTSERTTSTVAGFAVSPDGLVLAPIGHWPVQAQPRSFAITADGRWMMVAGQRSHTVGLYRIDPADGGLEPVDEAGVGRGPAWVEWLSL